MRGGTIPDVRLPGMKAGLRNIAAVVLIAASAVAAVPGAGAQSLPAQSQPNEESRKLPTGSAAERKARMAARANAPAYTKKFDLSALARYSPQDKPAGTLRICGNNYIGDSPLASWWKEAFAKFQPGITIQYNLPSAAIAIPCMYFGLTDIGINHEPSFYDYLGHLRLKGYEPIGFSVLTGAYCLLPILCFPVFLLVRPARRAALLLVMAGGFLAAYSAINWRTCSELRYCTSVISTLLETLKTRLALAFFSVAAISLIAEAIDDRVPHP